MPYDFALRITQLKPGMTPWACSLWRALSERWWAALTSWPFAERQTQQSRRTSMKQTTLQGAREVVVLVLLNPGVVLHLA